MNFDSKNSLKCLPVKKNCERSTCMNPILLTYCRWCFAKLFHELLTFELLTFEFLNFELPAWRGVALTFLCHRVFYFPIRLPLFTSGSLIIHYIWLINYSSALEGLTWRWCANVVIFRRLRMTGARVFHSIFSSWKVVVHLALLSNEKAWLLEMCDNLYILLYNSFTGFGNTILLRNCIIIS